MRDGQRIRAGEMAGLMILAMLALAAILACGGLVLVAECVR